MLGRVFTANANAQGTGGGQAKEFTDYVNMFGAADNNRNTEFKATISNKPATLRNGQSNTIYKFYDYAAGNGHNGVGHEFKANADGCGLPLTGPGKVIAFTNYQADFGAADNRCRIRFSVLIQMLTADSGPGVVTSYTDFVLHAIGGTLVILAMPREQFSLPIVTAPLSMEQAK